MSLKTAKSMLFSSYWRESKHYLLFCRSLQVLAFLGWQDQASNSGSANTWRRGQGERMVRGQRVQGPPVPLPGFSQQEHFPLDLFYILSFM